MGGINSILDINIKELFTAKKKIKTLKTFQEGEKLYKERHQNSPTQTQSSFLKSLIKNPDKLMRKEEEENALNNFPSAYSSQDEKSSKETKKIALYEYLGENFIKLHFVHEFQFDKVIKQLCNSPIYQLSEEEKNKYLDDILFMFAKEINNNPLYYYKYDLSLFKDANFNEDVTKRQIKGISSAFKYNFYKVNYEMNDEEIRDCFVLYLNELFFEDEDSFEEISDFIAYSESLKIIILILEPISSKDKQNEDEEFRFDGYYYNLVYKIFNSINKNKTIKAIFFHSVKEYNIILSPEISNLIIKKLYSETVIALHIGNFLLSENFYQKLMATLSSTRRLLFLSLEGKFFDAKHIEGFNEVFEKNQSILAFSLVNKNLSKILKKKKIAEIQNQFKKNSKLKISYFGANTIMNLDIAPNENDK